MEAFCPQLSWNGTEAQKEPESDSKLLKRTMTKFNGGSENENVQKNYEYQPLKAF